mgnify:FL=1
MFSSLLKSKFWKNFQVGNRQDTPLGNGHVVPHSVAHHIHRVWGFCRFHYLGVFQSLDLVDTNGLHTFVVIIYSPGGRLTKIVKMKHFYSLSCAFLLVLLTVPAKAQELSIDEAIKKITASAKDAIISGYRSEDETGDSQYVDAEIKSVHGFNDYSYGAMMDKFEAILARRLKVANSSQPSSMWPEERAAVRMENPRLLEYAKANQTRLVGYSAVVDYVGITKFRERNEASAVLYFDAHGEFINSLSAQYETLLDQIIGSDASGFIERNDIKGKLAPYMFRQIVSELQEMNDPLFLRKEYWISDVVNAITAGKKMEMQWCYRLTKENTDDSTMDKGNFRAYYYQIQTGTIQVIKMLLVVDGTYEKDKNQIQFSYKDAKVQSYHISLDALDEFSPGNYRSIDYRICIPQSIETMRAKKLIRDAKNNLEYTWLDDNSFRMIAPIISSEPIVFHKQ